MNGDWNEKVCALALGKIFGYEPQYIARLTDAVGSASGVFALSKEESDILFGPMNAHKAKLCGRALDDAEKDLLEIERKGFSFLPCTSESFPKLLKDCPDYPAGLYINSSCTPEKIFGEGPAISIVGTRDISPYGKEWCPKLVEALSWTREKPTIVSGLALGVDVCAHLAAIAYGLPTIAVIPTGIDDIYPRRHAVVAEKILKNPRSAIVTDYALRTPTLPVNFIRRNRIIAGLSQGTVLVESKSQGGGTMTARLAYGYGRTVMALPGRIDDIRSEGCNLLIHEKVADPIFSAESLADDLGLGTLNRRKKQDFLTEIECFYYDDTQKSYILEVAKAIRNVRNRTMDDLCDIFGFEFSRLAATVRRLESDGFIDVDLFGRCNASTIRR